MLACWWTLIFAQLSIQYCLNRRNKLIFLEKRLSLPTTQARFLIGPLHCPLIGLPIWALFWKRFQAWYREVLLRQVTDGVVYSSNRDSFVNWDMTLGTKWTAEEYTNSQGTVITSLSLIISKVADPLEPILTWISRIESTCRTFGTIWNSIHSRSSFDSNWISDSRNSYDCEKESKYSQVKFFKAETRLSFDFF